MSSPTATPPPSPGAAAGAPVLELRALTRTHGSGVAEVHALRGISLSVYPGELVAVMGPSGSGKSTLLTLAGGLDDATSGQVIIEGQDIASLGRKGVAALRRRSVGYVFQDYNLIPALTAAENIALPRELDGVSVRKARKEALAALAEMKLTEIADRFPDEMSGGQQQRVAIARALVGDRRLVLADEPTGALDSETGEAVLALLRTRCDQGAAGVMVTHEPRYAAWADRVVFLRDGSIVDQTLTTGADALLTAATPGAPGSDRGNGSAGTSGTTGATGAFGTAE
ncbi:MULTISPECIES: ABC transporter ATP-binding protein [Streptomyces]|uniref:ABC transporter ATP-binding protein n=1 Tax=Streptomyces cavourensis TaxID=67258 RepID=A0AAD0Q5M5_9ACTN|nr:MULTISPECIES: ABC transporter ATP-binding protein [Streptomyces]NUW22295.1 ABC transporter ATP-binding protein [Streptomyces roseoviolaceus]ATY96802.1 macrolide ABC transporter ATP-binding protein [Streptomyces cavourensis]AXI72644.1 ABC transporter ATP-binding protein [Streptomyces cavourensis]MBT3077018.1 ABC transporter ATP-binding protein [Streptomyces sp. COG21]MBT3082337.1 ABC transporter ATP-binding protein [Streptomyces sp. COG20]